MTWWHALILGIVQGLGEFLPISSSGHIVLLQNIFGITEAPLFLTAMLHLGTLVSVFVVLWKEFLFLFKKPFKVMLFLILATIPAVIAQLTIGDLLESTYSGSLLGWSFLFTAVVLIVTWFIAGRKPSKPKHAQAEGDDVKKLNGIKWYRALIMGVAQAIAILPGVTRSGTTLCSGLLSGVDRDTAVRFSFLMSMPAVGGSLLLQAKDILEVGSAAWEGLNMGYVCIGIVAAAITGLLSLKLMFRLVRKGKLWIFGVYTGVLGTLVVLDQCVFHLFF